MITYKSGNLLESNCSVICHQVNCQRVMGSGIAKQIKDKWPEIFDEYCKFIDYNYENGICRYSYDFLGMMQPIIVTEPLIKDDQTYMRNRLIINFFSQDKYLPRNICHTNYDAFRQCCISLREYLLKYCSGWTIGFPYKIGCGLAGGDWPIVEKIIEEELGIEFIVEIYQYNM